MAAMNILLVDDDEESSGMLAVMLRHEGYGVEGCANAAVALVRLAATHYDVMMTDQTMPGMKGTELVVAALLLQSGLRCIIATGHNPPDELLRGETTWITKPLDVDALIALLGPASATAA
jgi:DNA-binding NtrC family response regulator